MSEESKREVEAQGEHESDVEAQGGQEEDSNSVHEESHVSNMILDHGPHMRSARGQLKTWRAAREAGVQVADGSWVQETRMGHGGETE